MPAYKDKKKERVAILNTLAAYFTIKAANERNPKSKESYWSLVVDYSNKASKIDIQNKVTWLGKGVYQLLKGEYDAANRSFDSALEGREIFVPALLGKAVISFNKKSFAESIKFFRKAISSNPGCPAEVRFGLGMCFYKQNKVAAAKQCFERVLEIDPANVEALVSLAILELNSESTKDKRKAVEKAFSLIQKAHKSNPRHPRVLVFLADHFFLSDERENVARLANEAFEATEIKEVKAESKLQLARLLHTQGKLSEAFDNYLESTKLWPQFALAQYGLGQLYIWKKDYNNAIQCFEKVVQNYPNNFEAHYALGSLYLNANKEFKALEALQKAVELCPHEVQPKVLLAQLIQKDDHQKALKRNLLFLTVKIFFISNYKSVRGLYKGSECNKQGGSSGIVEQLWSSSAQIRREHHRSCSQTTRL